MKTCQPILFVGFDETSKELIHSLKEKNYRVFVISTQDEELSDLLEKGEVYAISNTTNIQQLESIQTVIFDQEEKEIEEWLKEYHIYTQDGCLFFDLGKCYLKEIYTLNMSLEGNREFLSLRYAKEKEMNRFSFISLPECSPRAKLLAHQLVSVLNKEDD